MPARKQSGRARAKAPSGARPLCFVLMPFGEKADSSGALVDFDAVYEQLIRPAIEDAELTPIRADEEMTGGIIHKPMFERLVLCEYAVADLTTANANVFYELGVRHAVRPWSTVMIFAMSARLPFDVAPLRALPYELRRGKPASPAAARAALADRLRAARERTHDSPVFQLLNWTAVPDVEHMGRTCSGTWRNTRRDARPSSPPRAPPTEMRWRDCARSSGPSGASRTTKQA